MSRISKGFLANGQCFVGGPWQTAPVSSTPPVLWTRGDGCAELATALSPLEPVRVVGDLTKACIEQKAQLLVSRRLSSTDLIACASPVDFSTEKVEAVVAAVAGGPHSALAATIARTLGRHLRVPAWLACAYREPEEKTAAEDLVQALSLEAGVEGWIYQAAEVPALLEQLPENSLLVFGAPGGSWFQRSLFGQGARLRHNAPRGAVIVRSAPTRVFQTMSAPVFVGPLLPVPEALKLHEAAVVAVVDEGKLVGLLRRSAVIDSPQTVEQVMEGPRSALQTDAVEAASELAEYFDGAPIPVVDRRDRLVGAFDPGG